MPMDSAFSRVLEAMQTAVLERYGPTDINPFDWFYSKVTAVEDVLRATVSNLEGKQHPQVAAHLQHVQESADVFDTVIGSATDFLHAQEQAYYELPPHAVARMAAEPHVEEQLD